jgi:2-(3-amino-3-carboxypropyl)histidine synthase
MSEGPKDDTRIEEETLSLPDRQALPSAVNDTVASSGVDSSSLDNNNSSSNKNVSVSRPKRFIRRRRKPAEDSEPTVDPVLLDKLLAESHLPPAYSFEIPKTVQRIHRLKASHVALQMPEGLLMYSGALADLLKRLCTGLQIVSVLGDVTYGACCVEDLTAQSIGAQLLVHYGHSCLVPLQHTVIPCLYVFVEIQIDVLHMVQCLVATLEALVQSDEVGSKARRPFVYLLGTIQFRHVFAEALELLEKQGFEGEIPQVKPLSPGEVLGCTSPKLLERGGEGGPAVVCFVADGRFHLESTMISNPHIDTFYRYDPYGKTLTIEEYEHQKMKDLRWTAIEKARTARTFGIILGTLGRQGNPAIVQRVRQVLTLHERKHFVVLLSEISPQKLRLLGSGGVEAWVQVACPRLSVDWGHFLSDRPVLTPYELFCCMNEASWQESYPMDYYSQAGGPWTNYHGGNSERAMNRSRASDDE